MELKQNYMSPNTTSLPLQLFINACVAELAVEQGFGLTLQQEMVASLCAALQQQLGIVHPSQLATLSSETFRSIHVSLELEIKIRQKVASYPIVATTTTTIIEQLQPSIQHQASLVHNKFSMDISWLGYIKPEGHPSYHFIAEEMNSQLKNYSRAALVLYGLLIACLIVQIIVFVVLYIVSGLLIGINGNKGRSGRAAMTVGITLISIAGAMNIFTLFVYPVLLYVSFVASRIILMKKVNQAATIVTEKHGQQIKRIRVKHYDSLLCSPICCFPLIGKKIAVETL